MQTLEDILGHEILSIWSSATCLTIYIIDWARIRDPQATKVGRYSVGASIRLDDVQLQGWRNSIVQSESWALQVQTRHRPTPTHLLQIESPVGASLSFYARHGKQLGYERAGQQIYADCSASMIQQLEGWLFASPSKEGV